MTEEQLQVIEIESRVAGVERMGVKDVRALLAELRALQRDNRAQAEQVKELAVALGEAQVSQQAALESERALRARCEGLEKAARLLVDAPVWRWIDPSTQTSGAQRPNETWEHRDARVALWSLLEQTARKGG